MIIIYILLGILLFFCAILAIALFFYAIWFSYVVISGLFLISFVVFRRIFYGEKLPDMS